MLSGEHSGEIWAPPCRVSAVQNVWGQAGSGLSVDQTPMPATWSEPQVGALSMALDFNPTVAGTGIAVV